MSFQYNQFKNPNNNNIYYADHTHNIHSGLDIHTDRFNHYNNPIRHADHDPGYHVHNKFNGNYAPNKYTIQNATRSGVIHPPKDPSIFEIKFPDTDIRGMVITDTF